MQEMLVVGDVVITIGGVSQMSEYTVGRVNRFIPGDLGLVIWSSNNKDGITNCGVKYGDGNEDRVVAVQEKFEVIGRL